MRHLQLMKTVEVFEEDDKDMRDIDIFKDIER